MEEREHFIALLSNQPLLHADAIVLLQGDGLSRVPHAAELFHKGYAPVIVLVGKADDLAYGSVPSRELKAELHALKVPKEAVIFEETAAHTRAEAERSLTLAKENDWKSLLIVSSPHHQYRAFLTFLKAMRDAGMSLILHNAPARELPWFLRNPWGRRSDLLTQEFERIARYQEMAHVASFADGILYLEWKESQP
ncbi:MAG: YdcF family protein [Candidatus Paceibacterota bacterium]|jgi:uncharacterized SAM-binding protein YcdF (DUF218 family)